MSELHPLLKRQLKRQSLAADSPPPSPAAWTELLGRVSESYTEADQDRYTLERSLSISSREMQELYEEQRRTSESMLAAERDKLREANRFLDSIFENIPDMIFVKDAESLSFVRFNRAGQELLGRTRAELIGKSALDLFPKEQAERFVAQDRAVLARHALVHIPEEIIETSAHGRRIMSTKKIPILDEDGTPRYLLGISHDITEAKRAEAESARAAALEREVIEHRRNERRLATQNAAARALTSPPSVKEAAVRLLQATCEGLDWDVGGFWIVAPGGATLVCEAFWRRPGGTARDVLLAEFESETRRRTFAPGEGMPGRVWSSIQPAWIEDVTKDRNFPRAPVAGRSGLRCGVGLPVVVGDQFLGVLELFCRGAEARDDELLLMLGGIGASFGQFLERQRAEDALILSEARFRRLFDANIVGLQVSGADGLIREANDVFLRMVGYTSEDLAAGRVRWDTMTPPESTSVNAAIGQQLCAKGVAGPFEKEYIRKDGSRVPVIVGIAALPGSSTNVGFALDITERKRMENALLERERLASLTAGVALALTRGDTLRDVLQRCAEAVEQNLDVAFVRIWTLDAKKTTLEMQASAGIYTHINGPHGRVPVGKFKIGLIALERRPHLTNDVQHDPRIGDPDWAKREGMVAFAGYPLLIDGELVGVMAMFARRALAPFVLESLGSIAGTVALGIKHKLAENAHARLEGQLRQAQKMDAIGRLAGGVAHDFNNMLAAITGYSDLTLMSLRESDPMRRDVEQIKRAAERAAQLTRQLLIFSRKQVLDSKVLDVNGVVRGMEPMLRRLIREDIDLRFSLSPRAGRVKVDPGQLEQVILNLVVNARDAMPLGGKVKVDTDCIELDALHAQNNPGVTPGRYVMLAVIDTGTGMSAEIVSHLFEPFFTTKEAGRGTGLGLSTTFGIVQQAGGHITVESEVGQGSTFRIFLPLVLDALATDEASLEGGSLHGTETVLLVEDEEIVREIASRILRSQGYTVIAVQNGDEALFTYKRQQASIDLLLTDVVMPHMNGRELYERLVKARADLKVIFMSGYTAGAIAETDTLRAGVTLLAKPFTADSLARKVREALDASPARV